MLLWDAACGNIRGLAPDGTHRSKAHREYEPQGFLEIAFEGRTRLDAVHGLRTRRIRRGKLPAFYGSCPIRRYGQPTCCGLERILWPLDGFLFRSDGDFVRSSECSG